MGEETKESAIQWHPAFYAGIQIEFSQEKEKLKLNKIAARWPAKAVVQFFYSF